MSAATRAIWEWLGAPEWGPPVVKRGERYGQDARCWLWAAIAGMGLPYNPVYDRLAEVGIERERQRVGPLPLTPGWILERGWGRHPPRRAGRWWQPRVR